MGTDAALPGFENSEAGIAAFNEWKQSQQPAEAEPTVVINEIMASNLSTIMDRDSSFPTGLSYTI